MEYKRFISYLYAYAGDEKGVNVGYVRCEQRQGVCRLTLNLQDRQGIEGGRYKVYLYKAESENRPVGYYLDELLLHRGSGELRKQTSCDNVWNTSRRIGDFDGIMVLYDTAHAYVSQWTDEPIAVSRFQTYVDWREARQDRQPTLIREMADDHMRESEGLERYAEEQARRGEETAAELSHIPTEPTGRSEETEADGESGTARDVQSEAAEGTAGGGDVDAQREATAGTGGNGDADGRREAGGNAAAQEMSGVKSTARSSISDMTLTLMAQRPKLPDFENHEIYDCVRIEPKDIGLLDMDNWKLGVNSFLTHGYYNYKYLLLGKLRFQDGAIRAVLGVPGVYDSKEQYIAKLFGFELFVPLKHTNIKTGNFGYWIAELA